MVKQRTDRLNSLLKEVLSEVIRKEVRSAKVSELYTVTSVSISKDLRHAKVYVSVIGDEKQKRETVKELNKASGFISSIASKQVVMRFFPALRFLLDDSVDKHIRIDQLLGEIHEEQQQRDNSSESPS